MKASDLRIGNWYKNMSNDNPFNQIKYGHEIDYVAIYCEPIQLTEEWLLKFGFEEVGIDKRTFCSAFIKDGVRVTLSNGGNVFYGKLFVQSVHQLQNLYFALTGEELTFK